MGKHGTRYAIQWHEEKLLMEEVAKGKERLVAWFAFAHTHAKILGHTSRLIDRKSTKTGIASSLVHGTVKDTYAPPESFSQHVHRDAGV